MSVLRQQRFQSLQTLMQLEPPTPLKPHIFSEIDYTLKTLIQPWFISQKNQGRHDVTLTFRHDYQC
ncbi:MAG: hypothetical protein CO186_06810 [Zetaproteobacteria bacterium CG_4_9_14_3_um_filter_49_83]|nr:MAG: hypothetical protein AUJ56_07480 [Zetaproteobacteria bacterium CG1_02_49_23]PIQ30405.1 MAG: hypothetical protein COW62_12550 [Zetaproteobacteria bacterium CG17_big_fil_post_rev_8_21_14_2_50_50_13]PIV29963.1 MAG: hypothetical protein COS35_09150 [Zetaproteobacteria bacterium CG02_land_8_20_14_3_00_50_9]PIY56531.1 MAG: hypothetical protein COZ00_03825 [Zetaproteobacteria bacterium CG_4_10_14_0_8_um_filter_49_80]PJA35237.1 MAG: hypothetical protein CO186_06810 [Zetaproteobacteria bacterium